MKHTQKALSAVIFIAILLMFSLNTSAIVWFNESTTAGLGGGGTTESLSCNQVEGAGHFLKAYSGILSFLQKIEIAESNGVDFTELDIIITDAISNLEATREIYSFLKTELEYIPHNPDVVASLTDFDYKNYCLINRLNWSIFSQVKSFLRTGNVEGLYGEALTNIDEMITLAEKMKKNVETRRLPELHDLWRLDEICSDTLRKGQYTARVFIEINNRK